MKQILITLVILAAVLPLALSCGPKKAQTPKILVLCYSQSGTTRQVAETFASLLGAELEAIEATVPYTGSFEETIARCRQEMETGALPELKPLSCDISAYDVIFLGYPIWFGTCAPPMKALVASGALSGKKIVPFCTFGSGGLDSSVKFLAGELADCEILPGYGVRAARIDAAPAEIDDFLKRNGWIEGEVPALADFPPAQVVTPEQAALFDAAVEGYPMIHARAEEAAFRTVPGGTEYLFTAINIQPEGAPAAPESRIKVHVLALEGQAPVFTQVLR